MAKLRTDGRDGDASLAIIHSISQNLANDFRICERNLVGVSVRLQVSRFCNRLPRLRTASDVTPKNKGGNKRDNLLSGSNVSIMRSDSDKATKSPNGLTRVFKSIRKMKFFLSKLSERNSFKNGQNLFPQYDHFMDDFNIALALHTEVAWI